MHKNNYSLELLINGRPVQEYYKDEKSFVESRFGTAYTLRFRNNSWKRVMAIFSVDGIETLKGKAASEADNGYIVDAFSSIEIKGWRIDEQNVAAFQFSDLGHGYNVTVGATKVDKQTGAVTQEKSSKNSGVVGVRVIEEDSVDHSYSTQYKKLPVTTFSGGSHIFGALSGSLNSTWQAPLAVSGCCCVSNVSVTGSLFPTIGYNQHEVTSSFSISSPTFVNQGCLSSSSDTTASFSVGRTNVNQLGQLSSIASNIAAQPAFDTSTTWGAKMEDKVKEVAFKRSLNVTDIQIYYASRASLEAFGIDFDRTKQIFGWPSAFEDKKEFCKLPPGWTGGGK